MTEPIEVRVRDCACPNEPHPDGDVVYLSSTLSLQGGLAAQADIIKSAGNGTELAAAWRVSFVRHGATGWNLLDEDGDPVPFDVDALLSDYGLAYLVAEKADEVYGDAVMRPLLARLKTTSPSGRTKQPTSPTSGSTPTPLKRSSRGTTAASKQSAA